MSEVYLPTRDSLGYQNVKQALEKIFRLILIQLRLMKEKMKILIFRSCITVII